MKQQNGFSLISTLIVASMAMAVLILGFKMVPVYNEYFAVQKGLNSVVKSTDVAAPASVFRSNFGRHAEINDIPSVDPMTISVTKDNGRATMQVAYRRELPLFANVGLYFEFDVTSGQ